MNVVEIIDSNTGKALFQFENVWAIDTAGGIEINIWYNRQGEKTQLYRYTPSSATWMNMISGL